MNPVREQITFLCTIGTPTYCAVKKDGKWYTGYTSDLRKRFDEHMKGKSQYTKGRGPFDLIYYEACPNEDDAKVREKYLKTGAGRRYVKNRLKRFLSLTG